jgi:hypothetical protein
VGQINVDYTASAGYVLYAPGSGTIAIASINFTTPRSGVVQLLSGIDARMDAWDDYTSVRFAWSDIATIVTNAQVKLPFGITRAQYSMNSAAGIALPAGNYTARLLINTAATNQMRVYSGFVTAHWTG